NISPQAEAFSTLAKFNRKELNNMFLRFRGRGGAAAAAVARFHGLIDFLSLNSIKSQCFYSTSTTSELVKYLVDSLGFSKQEASLASSKLPYCIALSEDKIQKALSFYMKRLGCEPAYLASHPSILVFSLEKRVVPRVQVLKILDEKKVERRKLGFYYALSITETKFMDYFVLPYKDQIPDLYEQLNKIVAP
ncbi:hypothetical protein AABB24_008151, partial [Solanum stoloniferum]